MTLEHRLAGVEAELAEMKAQQETTGEISKLMQEICTTSIKNALRLGGIIHKSIKKATMIEVAAFKIEHGSVSINPAKISASVSE